MDMTKFVVGGAICLVWVMSTACHEFAHAIVAYMGGDKSVKERGYLTLNPFAYTNTTTTLILPAVFLLLGGFALPGAAVYVRTGMLRNNFWRSAVSAAGPLATFCVTIVLALAFAIARSGVRDTMTMNIVSALAMLVYFHCACFLLNILPVPGLDGYGVIEPWLPKSIRSSMDRLGQAGFAIVLILLWMPIPNQMLWSTAALISGSLGVSERLGEIGFQMFRGAVTGWAILMIITLYIFRRKEKANQSGSSTQPQASGRNENGTVVKTAEQTEAGGDPEAAASKPSKE